jgi:hypothetical protein
MGTSTHFGWASAEMISTGRRWVVVSRASCSGWAFAFPLFHIHAETMGADRNAAKARGLRGLEAALMDGR